ncbi:hypothetical protein LUZ60_015462 [Juncus effusus]|nr:hypothetical protein LUZ60_015462 [Juncus effusus]
MQGFAANLSPEEVLKISRVDGVIGVYEDRVMKLQTTRSPYFLGLNEQYGVWPEAKFGQDVIIGLLDSGIWPESASFNDDGLGPVSSRWKGQCETDIRFNTSNCNNKLVGARFFYSGRGAKGIKMENQTKNLTPRDWVGHGTHTAAIAAGSTVLGANMFGLAKGAARGTAPRARLAVYKVCWNMYYGCDISDILKGIEKAIEDGVDIVSMSLGGDSDKPTPLYEDLHAIGTFAAVRHGIFVACAGGNIGPDHYSVDNVMPWVTTVGGSAVDRTFLAHITLGNGDVFNGESLFSNEANYTSRMVPILFPIHGVCDKKNLVTSMIRGKIVVCSDSEEEWDGVLFIEKAGGVGIIKVDNIGDAIDDIKSFNIPSININIFTFAKIVTYLKSTENPVAKLDFRKIVIGDRRAPTVAGYSSRGPSIVLPEILKPDILAPGSNILSAWPSEVPLFDEPRDPRRSNYNILKGTSMSCPHVAGIGALLRQVHPLWSPAMIRSALMTTASLLDNYLRPILLEESSQNATPFEFGAGHVNPQRALDPGLVYDAGVQDYIDLLCTLNYTENKSTNLRLHLSNAQSSKAEWET